MAGSFVQMIQIKISIKWDAIHNSLIYQMIINGSSLALMIGNDGKNIAHQNISNLKPEMSSRLQ